MSDDFLVRARRPALVALVLTLVQTGSVGTQPAGQPAADPPAALLPSVLVNDPNADASSAGVTQRSSSIVLGSGSNLIAAFFDTGSYVSAASPKYTGYARSTDGGETWADMGALPGTDLGEPTLVRDTASGRLYLSTQSASPFTRVELFRSDDQGVTWLPAVDGGAGGTDPVLFKTIVVDNFAGPGQGNVYIATTRSDDPLFIDGVVRVTRSTDGGATFSINDGGVLTYGFDISLAVGADHAVYVFANASTAPASILMRKSTDFGVTFGTPVRVAPAAGTAPRVAINPANGEIYVAFDHDLSGQSNIFLTRSTDGGATWSEPLRLNDDGLPRVHQRPSIAITPDGTRLFVGWYDRRGDPANELNEYWGVIANISGGGFTVGPNFVISDQSFLAPDSYYDPIWQLYPHRLSEANGAAADSAFFYSTWADTRTRTSFGGIQADIRLAKVPVVGPGDILGLGQTSPATFDLNITNDVSLQLWNKGTTALSGISATLASTTPNVVIEQPTFVYPDLAPGAIAASAAPLRVRLTCLTTCPATVDLILTATTSSGSTFTLPTQIPVSQRVSIGDAIRTEGQSGLQSILFPVRLSGPSTTESRVWFSTENGTAAAPTFTSTTPLTIPDGTPASGGPATPYPATVNVTGLPSAHFGMTVRLNGLTHQETRDLDILLVAPSGGGSILMSDLGFGPVTDIDLTFTANGPLYPIGPLQTGVYRPLNNAPEDIFAAPAPPGPYTTLLLGSGPSPNGTWSLYVMDDTAGNTGTLESFSLTFNTPDGDFHFSSQEIVFAPGTVVQQASASIVGDTIAEPNETFTVRLFNPTNTIIVDGEATGTILNDDGANLPTAVADSFGGSPGQFTVPAPGVLANDLANGGGVLSALLLSAPTTGTLQLAPDGAFTYTTPSTFGGFPSFTYLATTANGASSPVTVSLAIGSPPIAANDSYTTPFQTPLTVSGSRSLLANDTLNPVNLESARVQIVGNPSNGTLTTTSQFGEFTYAPNAGFSGTDTFTYRVTSVVGAGNTATVSILVGSGTVGPPVAVNDNYTIANTSSLNVPSPGVLANDSSTGNVITSAVLVSGPAVGTHSLNGGGGLMYTPPSGFVGTVTMTYRAVNPHGQSNVATITIVVTGNPGPPLTVADTYSATFQTPLSIAAPGVLANDHTNAGGPMSAQLVSNATRGTLTLSTNGSFTYIPGAGFVGTDTFTYRAVNSIGNGTTATVTINVAGLTTLLAPINLRVQSVVGNLVTLRWDQPAGGLPALVFELEGGVSPGQVLASLPTGSEAPVFTFTAPSGSFFIRVHARNGGNKSPASNEVRLHVNVPVVPSAPADVVGSASGGQLNLSWRPTFEGGPATSTVLDVTGAATLSMPLGIADRFNFAGVPAGTYTFRVRQTNAGGSSAASDPITLTFPGTCAATAQPPSQFLAYRSGRTIFVMWEPPATGAAAASYVLDVTGAFVGTIPTPGRGLSGGVGPGTYNLRVQSVTPCGASAFTAVQTVVVP